MFTELVETLAAIFVGFKLVFQWWVNGWLGGWLGRSNRNAANAFYKKF